ncbi:hypothetical protein DFJ74DRAFT_713761 [Hyaloraphidium curvatum]|nr:hypothetical protein DFJ74DRAFT_713761 [Hyaloraphidium curvatum]
MDAVAAQRRAIQAGVGGLAASFLVGLPYSFVVLNRNLETFNEEDKAFAKSDAGKGPIELGAKIPGSERAWRMAHLEGLTNGFLALLVAALIPSLKLEPGQFKWLANATAVCVAGNVVGSTAAALGETRGLMGGGTKAGRFAFWNFNAAVFATPVMLYYLLKGVSKI